MEIGLKYKGCITSKVNFCLSKGYLDNILVLHLTKNALSD